MHVFKNERFEVGVNIDAMNVEDIHRLFQVLRDCPDCCLHGEAILDLEKEVWQAFLGRNRQ